MLTETVRLTLLAYEAIEPGKGSANKEADLEEMTLHACETEAY
jgi:hypothetical protein